MNDYQKNIINAEKFYAGSAVSNIGGVLSLKVEISDEDCRLIIREIVSKTSALRLKWNGESELCEYEDNEYFAENIRIRGNCADAVQYAERQMKIPFSNLYNSPLFEIKIFTYDTGKVVFLKLHHVLGDAATIGILCKRFEEGYYELLQRKKFVCQDIPVVYPSLSDEDKKKAADFFAGKLTHFEPIKLSEKESRDCSADKMHFELSYYEKNMTDLFVAAMYLYLSSVLNTKKVVVGFVLGNRKKEEWYMPGMFANTLPLVMEFENGSFRELRKMIRTEIFNLIRCSAYSMDELKQAVSISDSLYDISVSYRSREFVPQCQIGTLVECFNGCLDVPMRISIEENENGVSFDIYYKKNIYSPLFIENMGHALDSIIKQGVKTSVELSEINLLTDLDKQIYENLNATVTSHKYQDVIECFNAHISNRETVVWQEGSIDGFELQRRSQEIATYIRRKKAKTVGIRMIRSPEMIESVLGTLMAGSSFMIISDTIPNSESYCDLILCRDDVKEIREETDSWEKVTYAPESTAYRVCTSGSTGRPKCIEISRASLMARLEWADRQYGLRGSILQKTVNTFDVAVWEMLSVIFGARLCLLPEGDEKLPDRIAIAMLEYGIEKVHFVPSVLHRFLRYTKAHHMVFPKLREVFVSGEKLESSLVDAFFEQQQEKRLINLYGPAECTIDVTFYECVKGHYPIDIPIGKPVANTQIYIMNDENKCLPAGTYGEICVMGELVGKGYVSGDQETQEQMVYQSSDRESRNKAGFCMIDGKKAYRTGDIGKVGFDGNLYIQGRRDHQIKIRGIRIDLSDIKNIVLQSDGVTDAEVIKCGHRIECYYCGEIKEQDIQADIAKNISVYAIPSIFKKVDSIPLTTNGKTDISELQRQSVEQLQLRNQSSKEKTEMLSGVERELLKAVSQYVEADRDDNLFEAGLDSISVLDIVCHLQEKGYHIDFSDFYENLTIRRIAKNIGRKRYYTYLKENNSDYLVICFPFAGGEPQNFTKIAKIFSCDVIGVYTSAFSKSVTVEEMALRLSAVLPLGKYKKIYVYGQCVGCMIALEFASLMGERTDGVILVAPTVRKKSQAESSDMNSQLRNSNLLRAREKVINPWSLFSDQRIIRILRGMGGNYNYKKTVINQFRKDTDRYFRYRPRVFNNIPPACRVTLVFGNEDLFTINRRYTIRNIQSCGLFNVKAYGIKGGKHFLNDSHSQELYKIIKHRYPELMKGRRVDGDSSR